MKIRNEKIYQQKKNEIMEKCFDCYAEAGLSSVGIKTLAKSCNLTSGSLYTYFDNLDDLIIESTEFCMTKVENDYMEKVKKDFDKNNYSINDLIKLVDDIPYWTARNHGKKYRLMYQVYTHPKYIEYGKKFFEGVNERYTEYAKLLEIKLGVSYKVLLPLIFILVRASVHYSLFEDEFYLKSQMEVFKNITQMYIK